MRWFYTRRLRGGRSKETSNIVSNEKAIRHIRSQVCRSQVPLMKNSLLVERSGARKHKKALDWNEKDIKQK